MSKYHLLVHMYVCEIYTPRQAAQQQLPNGGQIESGAQLPRSRGAEVER